jgi:hypothetical protein
MTITRPLGARNSDTVADHPVGSAAGSDSGPVKRVIVASFGAGALLMLILTVVWRAARRST